MLLANALGREQSQPTQLSTALEGAHLKEIAQGNPVQVHLHCPACKSDDDPKEAKSFRSS